MNGPHDLGGHHGFGPVTPEKDEPLFHAPWERKALALTLAMGGTGTWSIDESRHARESLPPADYLSFSYYRIWLTALENLLSTHGLASKNELAAGHASDPARPVKRVLEAGKVAAALAAGGPCDRPPVAAAGFAIGDRVRSRLQNPATHTRLPAYATGRPGTIHAIHGTHVFPDTNAHGGGENPQWLYSVRFAATDLWGADTTASDVFIDMWEPYLERV